MCMHTMLHDNKCYGETKRTIKRTSGEECNFKFKYPGLCWSNWEGIFEQRF